MSNTTTFILLAAGTCLLVGCAVGTGPAGEIILGVKAGVLAKTAEQGLIGAAGLVPGIGPLLSQIMMGAVASGATVAGVAKMVVNKVEKRRKASDQTREELRVELAEVKAKLEAENSGP